MVTHENQGARSISIIVAVGCVCVMLSIFAAVAFEMRHRAIRVYRKKFISARPPWYYMWGPHACGKMINIAFCWWMIKGVVFESSADAYCSANYPVNEFSQCNNDDICQLYEDDDGTIECASAFTDFYIARWAIVSFLTVIDLCCLYCMAQEDGTKTITQKEWAKQFWERNFWKDFDPECAVWYRPCEPERVAALFFYALIRYGIHSLLVWLHYVLYSRLLPYSDASIQWYDVWPVLCLVALKTSLHICYFRGKQYSPEKEKPHQIREILVSRLSHSSLAAVVESYLPLYHDSRKCPAELLAIKIDIQ